MFTNTFGTQNGLPQQQQSSLAGQSALVFGNTGVSNNIFGQTQQITPPIGQAQNQGVFGQQPNQLNQPQLYGGQPQQPPNLLQQPQGQQIGNLSQQTAQLGQVQQTGFFGQQSTLQGGQIGQVQQQQQLQQQQPQQQQQQQQQQQTKHYTIQQIKNETQKHIDNLQKTIINKEKIEKNQKNLQLIEKNSLRNIQQQQQQQQAPQINSSIGYGITQQQQQIQRPIQKVDPRNHTAKVEKYYNEWNKGITRITQKQGETINQLNELNSLLSQQDSYSEIDEESLIDSIKQLGKDLNLLEYKIVDVVKLQEKILGLEKEESEWDQIVNNLSECLTLLEVQTKEVEDQLHQAEIHPKVLNK